MRNSHSFDFDKFVAEVFAPQAGEIVVFLTDTPTKEMTQSDDWRERLDMVNTWRDQFEAIGRKGDFEVLPLVSFPATGHENSEFPKSGEMNGSPVEISDILDKATLAIAMCEYSMSAGLVSAAKRSDRGPFRAASAPLARRDMEDTCYNIDYRALRERCIALKDAFENANGARVRFSGGYECWFDLRHRICFVDDGYLHPDKSLGALPLINLPSGEVGISPYEGEIEGDPSGTEGKIPVPGPDGGIAIFHVFANRVTEISGDDNARRHYEKIMDVDPARRNVGEISFGCNGGARISGLYIEDEKAGFHWGYGRSDFLGGVFGPEKFLNSETVLHDDTPYANGMPVTVELAELHYVDGGVREILREGEYVL